MRIQIPFRPHFKEAIIGGRKTAPSRTRKYGSPGDEFEAFGYVFVIERQRHLRLEFVANQLYAVEGFQSPLELLKEWRAIHSVKGFEPEQFVWVHWFHRKGVRHKPHFVPEVRQMELGRGWMTDKDITQRKIDASH